MSSYLITNFAYGTGPYIRTTELAIAFNDELVRRGVERMPVIIPLVYGDKQKRVMHEEFDKYDSAYPGHLLLDSKLGALLGSIFYADSTYENALGKWVTTADAISAQIREHLSGDIEVETLSGERRVVKGADIVLELNRSPRVIYGIAPSYSTTFGHIADILEKSLQAGSRTIATDPDLLRAGANIADSIEGSQDFNAMAYPGTFSWMPGYIDRYNSVLVPPITNLHESNNEKLEDGLYVTITGIPGLERLYREALELGFKLYSNDTTAVGVIKRTLPKVISNQAIKLQFARSGWGSVWLSMFCGKPIVVPEYDPMDDPEIYFNNKAVEELGIGIVYRGQSLSDIIAQTEVVRANQKKLCTEIKDRWGTLNGNHECARLMVDNYLESDNH